MALPETRQQERCEYAGHFCVQLKFVGASVSYGHNSSLHCTVQVLWLVFKQITTTVKSFYFMDSEFCGLTKMDMFMET